MRRGLAFLRPHAGRAAIALATACAVLAPLAIHWLSGETLAWFDTLRLYAPQRWIVDEALRDFRLPLWNPFMGGGMPFLADGIHGVLHPVSILTAWLGTDRGADLLIAGYVLCAGLGALALARELGASLTAAALAAVVYGSSGFVLSMAGNLVFLAGLGSLPFCVAGLRRVASDPRPATLAFGAGGAAVLALSGDAQALMLGGGIGLMLAWDAGGWRGAARAVAAGAVGLLVAGVQLVPTAVHLPRTDRAAPGWSRSPEIWALEPWRVAELILPGFLGGADPLMDPVYGGLAGPGRWPRGGLPFPFAVSVFVGLVPVALATAGARVGRRGWLLAGVALVLLWMALGQALGADALLQHVPIWRSFRYSEKLVGSLTLVLAVLAALGLDAVVERRVAGWPIFAAAAAVGLAAVATCRVAAAGLAPDLAAEASARCARGSWHVLLAAVAVGGWLLVRQRLSAGWARGALAVLAWGGMVAATPAALRPGDPTARLRSPGPALAARPPGPRIMTPYSYEPLSVEEGADWIDQALRDYSANGYVALNVRSRLDSLDDYEAMVPAPLALLKSTFGQWWPVAARRFGVTHVIVPPPRSDLHLGLHRLATSGGTRLDAGTGPGETWAVPHREWASFAPAVRTVEDGHAAAAATARAFREQDPSVIVEAVGSFAVGPGRVISMERGLESLRLEAEADADATLVIADAWWPGWEATLDGRRVSIFRADVLVRAVRWPAGRHLLEMRYAPPEARTGLLVSVLGITLLATWIAVLRAPARRRGRSDGPASSV